MLLILVCCFTPLRLVLLRLRFWFTATGEVITTITDATAKDVDDAVQAAKKAFYTAWGTKVAASERGRLLNKLADLVERDADKLAAIEARDAGTVQKAFLASIAPLTLIPQANSSRTHGIWTWST